MTLAGTTAVTRFCQLSINLSLTITRQVTASQCESSMGKSKAEKKGDGVQQRHVHSRLSYLHQAAAYLSTTPRTGLEHPSGQSTTAVSAQTASHAAQSRHLLSQFREISQKTQIRVTPELKRSFCKCCQSLLIAGSTSLETITNASANELKPWADVFEIRCKTCGTVKRFPIGQQRPRGANKKKKNRTGVKPVRPATLQPVVKDRS